MKLEIRELDSSMVYDIGPEGAVLGRERAKTDIALRDESISKRHARIFLDNGAWFLEDLGSSNGTYIDNQRIHGPRALQAGMNFSLAQKRFNVVVLEGAAGSNGVDAGRPDGRAGAGLEDGGFRSGLPHDPASELPRLESSAVPPFSGGRFGSFGDPNDEHLEPRGFGYFFVALPKAVAYYLAAVPLMLLNPVGTVRKGVTDQKLPAMGWMELIAYALPAFVVVSLLSLIGGLVASLIGGGSISVLLRGAVQGAIQIAVVGVVSAAVVGLIAHPVTRWLVDFLGGRSTAKARTNFFLAAWTASILVALPSALAPIVAALSLPFLQVLPLLLAFVAAGVMLFVAYSWFKAFDVARWFLIVLMVAGGLYALSTAVTLVRTVVHSVDQILSGESSPAAVGPGGAAAAEEVEALRRESEALAARLAAGEISQEQYRSQAEALAASLARATAAQIAAAEPGVDSAPVAQPDAGTAAEAPSAPGTPGTGPVATPTGGSPSEGDGAGSVSPPAAPTGTADATDARDATTRPPASAGGSRPTETGEASPFQAFREKHKAIEDALERDPRLMRDPDIQKDYRRLLTVLNQRKRFWARKRPKTAADERIQARLKEADLYDHAHRHVERLHRRMFSR